MAKPNKAGQQPKRERPAAGQPAATAAEQAAGGAAEAGAEEGDDQAAANGAADQAAAGSAEQGAHDQGAADGAAAAADGSDGGADQAKPAADATAEMEQLVKGVEADAEAQRIAAQQQALSDQLARDKAQDMAAALAFMPPLPNVATQAFPYRVLSPLDHDGKRYDIGAEVQLTVAQAAPLLGHTVVAQAPTS